MVPITHKSNTLRKAIAQAKAEALVAWYQKNAEADGINSTPSLVIDGKKFSNMSFADLQAILDKKLAQ